MWAESVSDELAQKAGGGEASGIFRSNRAGLRLLLEARQLAEEVGHSLWDFAVEMDVLQQVGMTNSEFRWLTCKGLVEHGRDATPEGKTTRCFHCFGGLRFFPDTCFILTSEGAAFARRILAAREEPSPPAASELACNGTCQSPPTLPKWDSLRQQLRVGNVLVKQFKVPAVNQERILAAFEEEGWPCHIDDPLPPSPDQDPKRRLHDTINSLNRNQKRALLRFVGNGSGQGIRWELLDALEENGHGSLPEAPAAFVNGNGKVHPLPRLPR